MSRKESFESKVAVAEKKQRKLVKEKQQKRIRHAVVLLDILRENEKMWIDIVRESGAKNSGISDEVLIRRLRALGVLREPIDIIKECSEGDYDTYLDLLNLLNEEEKQG